MEERNDEMQVVEVENNGCGDYEITEYSDDSNESELDLGKILKWIGIGAVAIGGIALVNKDRIKEALTKRKEKKMRKYADELGYNVVVPEDYAEAAYDECDVEDEDCESDEE